METKPISTLERLMRSSSSRGGSRQTTSPNWCLRKKRSSIRNITLSTKERANAEYAKMFKVT